MFLLCSNKYFKESHIEINYWSCFNCRCCLQVKRQNRRQITIYLTNRNSNYYFRQFYYALPILMIPYSPLAWPGLASWWICKLNAGFIGHLHILYNLIKITLRVIVFYPRPFTTTTVAASFLHVAGCRAWLSCGVVVVLWQQQTGLPLCNWIKHFSSLLIWNCTTK